MYRVKFFKTLTNSYGFPFLVCQRLLDVSSELDAATATEAAKRLFEQCEDIPNWFLHADFVEIELLPHELEFPTRESDVAVSGRRALPQRRRRPCGGGGARAGVPEHAAPT